jgi:hydroxymethylbilane synthase
MTEHRRVWRVGTRGSALALWQADHVISRLAALDPGLSLERVIVKTTGDKAVSAAPVDLGETGLFTKELEQALVDRRIDIAVHSLKDLPTEPAPGLDLAAVLEREDPRDALLARSVPNLESLPAGARVGTSSLRRRAQLLRKRPDLAVVDLRGNVPTRLDKLERGEYDAIVVALAGLKRLGLHARVTQILEPGDLLPAPGQGAIGLQIRSSSTDMAAATRALDHRPTRLAVLAERALLARLEAGCHAPVGALATWAAGELRLHALVAALDGTRILEREGRRVVRNDAGATALGLAVADWLIEAGAAALVLPRARHTTGSLHEEDRT